MMPVVGKPMAAPFISTAGGRILVGGEGARGRPRPPAGNSDREPVPGTNLPSLIPPLSIRSEVRTDGQISFVLGLGLFIIEKRRQRIRCE